MRRQQLLECRHQAKVREQGGVQILDDPALELDALRQHALQRAQPLGDLRCVARGLRGDPCDVEPGRGEDRAELVMQLPGERRPLRLARALQPSREASVVGETGSQG